MVVIKSSLGVNDLKLDKHNLIIYPNPSDGVFTIEIEGIDKLKNIEIINILGEQVFISENTASLISKDGHAMSFDLSAFPKGVYFLKTLLLIEDPLLQHWPDSHQVVVKKIILN